MSEIVRESVRECVRVGVQVGGLRVSVNAFTLSNTYEPKIMIKILS